MGLTSYYAIDQERLARQHWDLADTYADLHRLAQSGVPGVLRITVADLRIVLDCCSEHGAPQSTRQRDVIARVRASLELAPELEPSSDMEV
jgi:hypothetical protein